MNLKDEKLETQRMQLGRAEIIERMKRLLPEDGTLEPMPGFFLGRSSKPVESVDAVFEPAFCFIVQGSKRALLGEEVFRYDPGHYLIFTVDLPVIFHVESASAEEPYLGVRLNLDPATVASVMMESGIEIKKNEADVKAIDVEAIDSDLLNAAVRLLRLLDNPGDFKMLSPLITREIIYRLLRGGQGARLGHLFASNGETFRISEAISHLRAHFDEPLRIETIAREFGMSVSGFHHHFKSVTAMTPLQFLKHLRLQEARRLMLGEELDAASAGFRVGYEDPSYFSRDYRKMFGAPPLRDIARLRGALEQ